MRVCRKRAASSINQRGGSRKAKLNVASGTSLVDSLMVSWFQSDQHRGYEIMLIDHLYFLFDSHCHPKAYREHYGFGVSDQLREDSGWVCSWS